MWCICCPTKDQFTDQWESEIENVIVNIKKARTLGKKCISKRELGRQDPKLENEILELIKNTDRELLNIKRGAVYFLTANTALYKERNDQIEFFRRHAQQQLRVLQLQKELLTVNQERKVLAEENAMLKNHCKLLEQENQHFRHQEQRGSCQPGNDVEGYQDSSILLENSKNENTDYLLNFYEKPLEFHQIQQLNKHKFENNLRKYDKMIDDLNQLLASYNKEQQKLKSGQNAADLEEPQCSNASISQFDKEVQDYPCETYNRSKNSVWLEQELETQHLLRIQASLGKTLVNVKEDLNKSFGTINKLKSLFSKAHQEPVLGCQGDDFQEKLQSYEDEINYLKAQLQERVTSTKRLSEVEKLGCLSNKQEEIELLQLGEVKKAN